jgi:hypothetical protein
MSRRNSLCQPREMDSAVWKAQHESYRPSGNCLEPEELLERREHTRYGVRAPVDFEWMEEGVRRRGQGLTRDINAKGMFIYSDSEPPTKADIRVRVSFASVAQARTKAQLSAHSLVVRVEPASSPVREAGFAILNRSYELHDGVSLLKDLEN